MSVIQNNLLMTPEGYQISRSVRLRSSASAYLSRASTQNGTSNTTWTYSGWVKRGKLSSGTHDLLRCRYSSTYHIGMYFNSSDGFGMVQWTGSAAINIATTQVFRDPSAWYHIVVAVDSTQATSSNRVKIYVNGVQVTSFSTATYPPLNSDTYMSGAGSGWTRTIGQFYDFSTTDYLDGYITEINFIDGQALTPSSFGETDAATGVWKPKKYAGTYGTNGFYLNFADNSAATAAAIGKDSSGNGNNWTPNNISVTAGSTYDSMLDTPTPYADGGNGRGNYCTLNPLDWQTTAFTLSNANLTWTSTTTATGSSRGTIGMTTGKWYWEVTATSVGSGSAGVGIAKDGSTVFGSGQALYTSNTGNKYIDGTTTAYGATWATNNVIGVAYDADAGEITFYKDNTSQGAISLSGYAGVNVCPVVADASSLAFTLNANFGQRPFAYTPPTGFKALNTQNLPDATIKKGNQYFDATKYTGNGSTQSIVNSGGFQPDLVWYKSRVSGVYNHGLFDSVRGTTKQLFSNTTGAEATYSGVTAFNSNGFSLGSDAGGNNNTDNYIAWQWKESVTAGFDIVTYTGTGANRTVAHSLGVAPKMIIVKNRTTAATAWIVYHASLTTPATQALYLNTTDAALTSALYWNSTAPTSSVFSVGAYNPTNQNTNSLVAYLFAEVAGFSKFGGYTGNGSADGVFVYCGFRPKYVLIKSSSVGTADWWIMDTARDTYNLAINELRANLSNAELTTVYAHMDILSNGFKLRSTSTETNGSGSTYIYAAFAENPFKNSLAR